MTRRYTEEELEPYRPKHGDPLTYKGFPFGKVHATHGNLCFVDNGRTKPEDNPFIWRFHDGLNNLFEWPGKPQGHNVQ